MNSADALDLAMRQHQAGKLHEAELLYRQILQAEPRHADALHLLGVIAHQVGRHDVAVETIRAALRERPNFAEAHCNLGVSLQALGQLEQAEASFRQAVNFKPGYAEAHNNLGNALRQLDRPAEAVASLQQALRLRPAYAAALTNLGVALQNLGRLDEAIAHHEQALRYAPNLAEAHNSLGMAQEEQGKLDEAKGSYEQAVRLKPDYAEAHNNLGEVLEELGDFAGAEQAYRTVLRGHPQHGHSLWHLASLLRGKLPAADRTVLEQCLAQPELNDEDRSKVLFGLAQVCDAKGEFAQAAAQLQQANTLALDLNRRKGKCYNPEENARDVDKMMADFTPAFFERVRGFGLETERPVFIVGLPRSGTTLTEQILAAHSQVFGAGELLLAEQDFQTLGTQPIEEKTVRRLGQRHLDQLSALNRTAARVVDKMPGNFRFLGLLAALFPRAKFIHCRRDLRDVAVSCWMTRFTHLRWANDPAHIVAHFRDYQRLMEHWRAVLPVPLLEINYEETVADLPGVARRLVEWCGLGWEPACLAFNEGTRPVRAWLSATQVRQPIYKRSVARWRNYEPYLSDLFAALGISH